MFGTAEDKKPDLFCISLSNESDRLLPLYIAISQICSVVNSYTGSDHIDIDSPTLEVIEDEGLSAYQYRGAHKRYLTNNAFMHHIFESIYGGTEPLHTKTSPFSLIGTPETPFKALNKTYSLDPFLFGLSIVTKQNYESLVSLLSRLFFGLDSYHYDIDRRRVTRNPEKRHFINKEKRFCSDNKVLFDLFSSLFSKPGAPDMNSDSYLRIVSRISCNKTEKYLNLDTANMVTAATAKQRDYIDHDLKIASDRKEIFTWFLTLFKGDEAIESKTAQVLRIIPLLLEGKRHRFVLLETGTFATEKEAEACKYWEEEHRICSNDEDLFISYKAFLERIEKGVPGPEGGSPIKKTSPTKERHRKVTKAIREKVWRVYHGASMDGLCYCCGKEITYSDWECAHVKAFALGGEDTVENLRTTCFHCNRSMGTMDLYEYIRVERLKGPFSKLSSAKEEI